MSTVPIGTAATGVGVVHLGAGAFARGHTWWCTAKAVDEVPGPWGVMAVAQRSSTVVDALRARGWEYDLTLRAGERATNERIGVVRDGLVAREEPDRLLEALASPAVHVVTITATEAGYPYDPATGALDVAHPDVAADLQDAPPRTVVGQVVAAAAARERSGAGPLSIVVCDNVHRGGDLLRDLAVELAERRGQHAAAAWLTERATFPSSVVDRIVPAVAEGHEPDVVAEPWFRWVVEDRFAGPRPSWEAVGATLVDDVGPWQQAKLSLVNAPHSMLAYLGLGLGCSTVPEASQNPRIRDAVEAALEAELLPSVTATDGLVPADEAAASLRRFANSAIPHRLAQVGSGGSDKLPQRLTAALRASLEEGRTPTWSAGTIAAWAGSVQRGEVQDRRADVVRAALGQPHSRARAAALLGLDGVFAPDVRQDSTVAAVAGWLEAIERNGLPGAIDSALSDNVP